MAAYAVAFPLQAGAVEQADASQAPTLPEVRVEGDVRDDAEAGTVYASGPPRSGVNGGTHPYTWLSTLPGAQVETFDAYGLSDLVGANKGLRVRGELAPHGANGTVEGLPLNGPNPGPGYLFLFDAENIAEVSLAEGAVAPERYALYDTAGAPDTRLRWPGESFALEADVDYGGEDFRRAFARIDSGRLDSGTSAFASASASASQKWRGSGDSPAHHEAYAVAIGQKLGRFGARLFIAHADTAQDSYRGLSGAQAHDLDNWYGYDFAAAPGGASAQEQAYWQGYNRQEFRSTAALGELAYRPAGRGASFEVKPFYMREDGRTLDAMPNGKVRYWPIEHDWYGMTTRLAAELQGMQVQAGYAYVSMEPPAPPVSMKLYAPTADGDLDFYAWSALGTVHRRHDQHQAHVQLGREFGALSLEAGLRYVRDILPAIDAHNSASVGDMSTREALAQSSVDATRSVASRALSAWLPYAGASYRMLPWLSAHLAAGRNFGPPALEVYAAAPAAGLRVQDYWEQLELETADAVDLGLRADGGRGFVDAVLYLARYDNKAVSFYDPALGAAYTQNVAHAEQYGLQLSGGWRFGAAFALHGALNWGRNAFTEDLRSGASTVRATDGRQLPDVPALSASVAADCRFGPFTLSPAVVNVGRRYVDPEHTAHVASYTRVDVTLAWQGTAAWQHWSAALSATNLLDRHYIGYISADELASPGGTTYYPAAPFTLSARIARHF